MTIRIPLRLLGPALATAALLLMVAAVGFLVLREGFGHDHVFGLARLFDVNEEQSIPTWFSAAMLAVAAVVLALHAAISRHLRDRQAGYWQALAAGFLVLSVDEVATMHEKLGGAIGRSMIARQEGLLYYHWVVPAGILVLVVGAAFLGFLRRQPARVRRGMVCAGALFVAGAIGVEMINGRTDWLEGRTLAYQLGTIVEELLEMAGVALFVHVLALHLARRGASLAIELAPAAAAAGRDGDRRAVAAPATSSIATAASPARTPTGRRS